MKYQTKIYLISGFVVYIGIGLGEINNFFNKQQPSSKTLQNYYSL